MKQVVIVLLFIVVSPLFSLVSAETFWLVQSIDTMKYSRDPSREPGIKEKIPEFVEKVASLHPTHIVVATPYNDEFLPVLTTWVSEARKRNLKIWYRGNWSEWEGWFGYERFTNFQDHHLKTYEFIINNPYLFEDGDIFTPVPEAENGGPGDPRGDAVKAEAFRNFLIESYNNCEKAKEVIQRNFICGYFSVNGDIAKEIFTKDMVKKTGNVVVIDHFVKTSDKLVNDILHLNQKYQAPIVLGEYGTPIPDIHGNMTEQQQASLIQENLAKVVSLGSVVQGINYWTAFGGSTRLFEESTFEPRKATDTVRSFYKPPKLQGIVTDQYGNRVSGVVISVLDGAVQTTTDKVGKYTLPLPGTLVAVTVSGGDEYQEYSFETGTDKELQIKNITLLRNTHTFLEKVELFFRGVLSRILLLTSQS